MNDKSKPVMPVAATPLKQALHDARIEAAERSAVIIDLRDAEMARLEILNEAIDGVFKDIPARHTDYFDRGVSGANILYINNFRSGGRSSCFHFSHNNTL